MIKQVKFFNLISRNFSKTYRIDNNIYIQKIDNLIKVNNCINIIEIIDTYKINNIISISVVMSEAGLLYCVDNSTISGCRRLLAQILHKSIQNHILEARDNADYDIIKSIVREILYKQVYKQEEENSQQCSEDVLTEAAMYYTSAFLSSYGPLYPLIVDDKVEEIALDPPSYQVKIIHRHTGPIWISTNITVPFGDAEEVIIALARRSGRDLSLAHPYAEGLLPEGHRLAATLGREISRFGSSLVIRKHREKPLGIPELISQGVLTPELAAYLWLLVEAKRSAIVVGPTASGKTTLLQAMLDFVAPWSRVVSVEDTPELNLSHHPNWDSLVARLSTSSEADDIDLHKLAKFSLRRRPDYLVIGEIRGEEARVLAYAASSGHAAYTTMHADTAQMAFNRLLQEPFNIPKNLLASIDALIVMSRSYGKRFIAEIVELDSESSSDVILVPLYRMNSMNTSNKYNNDYIKIFEQSVIVRKLKLEENIINIIKEKIYILNISKNREKLLNLIKKYYYEKIGVIT